jgi:hypothetical protein
VGLAAEVTGLTPAHTTKAEQAIIAAAPGLTTGQLRAATRRAVLAADPTAAQRRKHEAQREARVERWTEPAGTAALAGRDLPPAAVLAADANLTALATQLKNAGADGTMDTLRARIYLALLTGTPAAALLPTTPTHDHTSTGQDRAGTCADRPSDSCPAGGNGWPADSSWPSAGSNAAGKVNLIVPLATWLGQSQAPGHVAGYGPLDAPDSRALAQALATRPSTQWCLTLVGPDGRPLAHGCARDGPPGTQGQRSRAGPRTTGGKSGRGPRDTKRTRTRDGPDARSDPGRPDGGSAPRTWAFTMTLLTGSGCDHAWETPAYRPSAGLRHLVDLRHSTCVFPGCRRPAAQCDADHTLAYDSGGKTCLCKLSRSYWVRWEHEHRTSAEQGIHLRQAVAGQRPQHQRAG